MSGGLVRRAVDAHEIPCHHGLCKVIPRTVTATVAGRRGRVHLRGMRRTEQASWVRDNLRAFITAAAAGEDLIISRYNRPEIVLIGIRQLAALEETLQILADATLLDRLEEAVAQIAAGATVPCSELEGGFTWIAT